MILDRFIGVDRIHDCKVIHRHSVRIVVKNKGKYLMISTKRGDLIFPGGGREVGESNEEAAKRELEEETGYRPKGDLVSLGRIITRRQDRYEDQTLYESTMDYYQCQVFDEKFSQSLSSNEIDLAIKPIWLEKSEIIKINRAYEDSIGHSDVWVEMVQYVLDALEGEKEKGLFESERCYFLSLQACDYYNLKRLFMNPQVRKYLGGPVEEKAFEKKFEAMLEPEDYAYFYVIRNKINRDFIGLISLDPHQDGLGHEISYQLLDDFWSMGYGRECVKRIIDYAFEDLGFKSLVAETQSLNKASCRLLESLSMKLVCQTNRYQASQNIYLLKR